MYKVALIGAGGKMGCRPALNLKRSNFIVSHFEICEKERA